MTAPKTRRRLGSRRAVRPGRPANGASATVIASGGGQQSVELPMAGLAGGTVTLLIR